MRAASYSKINWRDHTGGKTTVLSCMDPRFAPDSKDIDALMLACPELGRPDVIREAGSALALVDRHRRHAILHSIKLSVVKHGSSKVILLGHHDCGDAGGAARFNGDEMAERQFHGRFLNEARKIVVAMLTEIGKADVAVELVYLSKTGITPVPIT